MQTYRFALTMAGDIADITTLDTSCKRSAFRCLSCDGAMVARLGMVRDRCFAHTSVGNCSSETYLHVLGKFLFSQVFKGCQRDGRPFWVGRIREICSDIYIGDYYVGRTKPRLISDKVDFCRFYDNIETECGIGGFVADLLLTDKGGRKKPTCLEIKVSHGLTEEKSGSGLQIIEITVISETVLAAMQEADVPAEAVSWTGFPDPTKRIEALVSDLRMHFGEQVLRFDTQLGQTDAIQIYWHIHKMEYVAIRGGIVVGVGSSISAAAEAAGVSISPVLKLPTESIRDQLPSRPEYLASRIEYPEGESSLLEEVIAVFGGQVLEDDY